MIHELDCNLSVKCLFFLSEKSVNCGNFCAVSMETLYCVDYFR